jgi:anti-sigma B factor antagonist
MTYETNFVIHQKENNDVDCLYLKGYLDAHTAPNLENTLQNLVNNGRNKILINFRDLDYISSAGLGVFMAFIEDVREAGGDIKMSDMQPKVFSVFDLLGFPMLFDIEKEENTAIKKFYMEENSIDE